MCNNLQTYQYKNVEGRHNYKILPIAEIPATGFGYKVFQVGVSGGLYSPYRGLHISIKKWMKWWNMGNRQGFTFFLLKRQAVALCKKLEKKRSHQKFKIVKIEYKKGLGKRFEPNKAIRMIVSLCKEYRVVEIL